MTTEWVDFKKVKEAVSLQMVLDHYSVKGLSKIGDELRGPCPIHKGSARNKNFAANVRKNTFKCFSRECGVHGNVLDFVAAMQQCSIRDAALSLNDWFKIGETQSRSAEQEVATDKAPEVPRGIYTDNDGALYEVMTGALNAEDFEPLVVYRELFGDYEVWAAPSDNFSRPGETSPERFTLIKRI